MDSSRPHTLSQLHQQHREARRRGALRGPAALQSATPRPAPPRPAPPPAVEPAPAVGGLPGQIQMTMESVENVQRAPAGTRFYCVADPQGKTHCAASAANQALGPEQRSRLAGQEVEPLRPDHRGTGHQQVARRAGIAFDEATARVGFVEGEGYGLSLTKHNDCERSYTFTSAFNCKVTPHGGRTLTSQQAQHFEQHLEASFPPCALDSQEG